MYIKTAGEAYYEMLPNTYIIDIEVKVQATKLELSMSEVQELAGEVVKRLIDEGLSESEITGGGLASFEPWWTKKNASITNYAKITITTDNQARAYKALEALPAFQENKRKTITINQRAPQFHAPIEVISEALKTAYQNAKAKAESIAEACNFKISECLWVEEGGTHKRASGSYGDYDFDMLGVAAGRADTFQNLEGNKRIATVSVTAKFKLAEK